MFAQLWLNGPTFDVAKTELGLVWAQDSGGDDATNELKNVPSCKGCWARMPPGVVVRGRLVVDEIFCVDSIEGKFQPISLKQADAFLQAWGLLSVPFIELGPAGEQPEIDYFRLLQLVSWGNRARQQPQWNYLADVIKDSDNVRGVVYREGSWRENIKFAWERKRLDYVEFR